MTIEIRACRDRDELAEYARIVAYVFASNDGMDEELATTQPEWTMCAFVDGKMAATMGTFPFTVRFNGAGVPMGGVTAVGTLPQYRRKGLLRHIMTNGLATCRERGQNIAILWASMGAIYQRFGYGLATSSVRYTFDPRLAALQQPHEAPGTIDLLTPEDAMPVIKPLYIEYATPRNLLIHRSMALWQANTIRPRKKGEPVYVAVYRNTAGTPRGYVVYTTYEERGENGGESQTLEVRELIPLDLEAYQALWEFVRRHDLVGKVVMHHVPEDDIAPNILLEPRNLHRTTQDGIWMRVVDAQKALGQRPYSARGTLRVQVERDELCPWNEGTFVLDTDGADAEVRAKDAPGELVVTPQGLASLISGHRSATFLARAGRITAASDETLRLADRLFATDYAPFTPNGF